MKKLVNYCSIILLLLLATSQVKAQSVDVVIRENGTERKESIDLPMSMTYPLDSLLNDWKAKNYIDLGKDCSTAEVNPLFSDSVYMDRTHPGYYGNAIQRHCTQIHRYVCRTPT